MPGGFAFGSEPREPEELNVRILQVQTWAGTRPAPTLHDGHFRPHRL
jgi:hypothetical protein